MTGKEFRIIRKSLGLSINKLSEILCVNERTVRRWEHETWPVPKIAELAINFLTKEGK